MAENPDFRLKLLQGRLGDLVYQFTQVQFSQHPTNPTWAPAINAYRCPQGIAICFDLAGVDKSQVSLKVEPRKLRLSGSRPIPEPHEKEREPKQILAMEIDSGHFEREVSFPSDVETEAVHAEYLDGYLWVYLPFRTQS